MEALLRFKQQLIKEADHQELDILIAYVLDQRGFSPIHVAASKGHTNVIREIVQHRPDSGELVDPYGRNALHMAIVGGHANEPDFDGNTPLHLATIERKTWILSYLKWDGRVNLRSKNKYGLTAIDIDRSIKEIASPKNIVPSIWGHLRTPTSWLDSIKILSRADQEEANAVQTYKQMGQTLLMVATLITTVTFTAAFTMPGGYNNNIGPDKGVALLESSKYLKLFIIADTIAMTFSIIAACLLFWGAVNSNKSSYVYYFTSAATLTYFALQFTAAAFTTEIATPSSNPIL
ncbi:hypothetical protein PRUPE_4G203300 [Prunus persica]|uniref:PGG domain-containing protein n=1 Tax=Prunus persica TaxID=3760 RepID=A0A251PNL7_PRUPE|nr:hypothetical protein PRUPE_4G203300 [Prunus persica]